VPTRSLPSDPNLEQLRNLAKTLQRSARDGEAGAVEFVREFHPRFATTVAGSPELASLRRSDVQLALARSYGFASWPKLRAYVETVSRLARNPHRQPVGEPIGDDVARVDEFLRLACLTYGADDPARVQRARAMLAEHPDLATATIHTVAAVGDVEAGRRRLAADPAESRVEGGPHRWEPLLYAAYSRVNSTEPGRSTLEVARLLLEAGADPNAGYLWEAEYPFTALTGAFGEGESGPHRTPPHQYAQDLARLLLEAGADPNDSQTLYNRQWSKDDRHLALLLEFGLGRGTGATVWHARLGLDHPTPQELVEEELRKAAESGRIGRVRLLLPHVADPDGLGCDHPLLDGRTAFELAQLNGHTEIAELLERAGAKPVPLTPVEQLRGACLRSDRVAVGELVANDPDILGQLLDRWPDLICAAAALDRVDSVRLLADLGFELNRTDRRTPLHEAAFHGHLDVVRTLIARGADPTIRDCDHDSTPLGWAAYAHQDHVVAYLGPLTR
jgi:hypothetical protein